MESELRSKLVLGQRLSDFDALRPFLPRCELDSLITMESASAELRLHNIAPREGLNELVIYIVNHAKAIFATLVYIKMSDQISLFKTQDLQDQDLPFRVARESLEVLDPKARARKPTPPPFLQWRWEQVLEFYNAQWSFSVPVFGESLDLSSFEQQTIFPFHTIFQAKGTPFSKVWKILVSPGHLHVADGLNDPTFALKEMNRDVEGVRKHLEPTIDNYLKEIDTMRQLAKACLNDTMHIMFADHIVRLKGVFERGSSTYLLLPLANETLYDLWYDDEQETIILSRPLTSAWFELQTTALLGAVALLHSHKCRHGDLKPDNILVYPEKQAHRGDSSLGFSKYLRLVKRADPSPGQSTRYITKMRGLGDLVIADFGLARVHDEATRARAVHTGTMSGAQRYEPPESSQRHPDRSKPWSRMYDIWSLGCIFLEFIIWAKLGKQSLLNFNQELGNRRIHKFWQEQKQQADVPYVEETHGDHSTPLHGHDESTYIIHPVVSSWIKRLEAISCQGDEQDNRAKRSNGYLWELFRQVRDHMLQIEQSDRSKAIQILRDIMWMQSNYEWLNMALLVKEPERRLPSEYGLLEECFRGRPQRDDESQTSDELENCVLGRD